MQAITPTKGQYKAVFSDIFYSLGHSNNDSAANTCPNSDCVLAPVTWKRRSNVVTADLEQVFAHWEL